MEMTTFRVRHVADGGTDLLPPPVLLGAVPGAGMEAISSPPRMGVRWRPVRQKFVEPSLGWARAVGPGPVFRSALPLRRQRLPEVVAPERMEAVASFYMTPLTAPLPREIVQFEVLPRAGGRHAAEPAGW